VLGIWPSIRKIGKGHPMTGTEEMRRCSSNPFATSALEGCNTGKYSVPILQEAEWAVGPVWTGTENIAHTGDSIPWPSSP
jgi:hypothetical protein